MNKSGVFEYDDNQRPTITRLNESVNGSSENVFVRENYWDDANRLARVANRKGGTTLSNNIYRYNRLDFLFRKETLDGATDYSYDKDAQLKSVDYPGSQVDESFDYDDAGNRVTPSDPNGISIGSDNQLLADSQYTYTYDLVGNLETRTSKTTNDYENYTWDHRNRLTKIEKFDSGNNATETIEYTYDALDRRTAKEITDHPGNNTTTETFVYDGQHIVLRFIDGDLSNRYLHGPQIDQILADEVVSTSGQAGDVYWMMTDHLGTVEAILEWDTTTGGPQFVNKITYDAFGEVESETNATAVDYLFGFTGRERDVESDFNYYRARYYDPVSGRFISQDPISFAAGDANLYRYVGNTPTTYTDPSGLLALEDGHHVIPRAIWDLFGFDPEIANEIWNSKNARIFPTPPSHNQTGHGDRTGYSAHIIDEMNEQLECFMTDREKNRGMSKRRQREFAKNFLEHILSMPSESTYIGAFNEAVEQSGIDGQHATANRTDLPRPKGDAPRYNASKGTPFPLKGKWLKRGRKIFKIAPGIGFFAIYDSALAEGKTHGEAFARATIDEICHTEDIKALMDYAGDSYQVAVDNGMDINFERREVQFNELMNNPTKGRIPLNGVGRLRFPK